jgi:predicted AAA+ superfamily ATPase
VLAVDFGLIEQVMIEEALLRIAVALERIAPQHAAEPDLSITDTFVWSALEKRLVAIPRPKHVPLDHLLGIESAKEHLQENIRRFGAGLPANHAMLWGARGTGKSALVKSIHAALVKEGLALKLIEVSRDDIATLPALAAILRNRQERTLLFIDDLSFERGDNSYKALKSFLDGGISGDLSNSLVVVTSNRRHLINRETAADGLELRPEETTDDQVALSDRFGLWLGFYPMDQATYLAIVQSYAKLLRLKSSDKTLDRQALQWAAKRGGRSGRVAWQFIVDRAGALGKSIVFED